MTNIKSTIKSEKQTRNIRHMNELPLDEKGNYYFVVAAVMLFVVIYNEIANFPMKFENIFLLVVFSGIGSLLPKRDHRYSAINRWRRKIFMSFPNDDSLQIQRAHTHSLAMVAQYLVAVALLQIFTGFSIYTEIMLDLTIGYVLYLIQTSFSKTGILWLYPFREWEFDPVTHNVSQPRRIPDKYLYKEGGETERRIGKISKRLFIFLLICCFFQIAIFPLFNYSIVKFIALLF